MSFAPTMAPAQEALRSLPAGDASAAARRAQEAAMPYTFALNDLRVLVAPSVAFTWNDNVNVAENNAQQDFIVSPSVQLAASYPVSQQNLLSLNVGAGYDQYLTHDEYSTLFLQSGTALSFDVYVKDFWINLHDHAQYVRGSGQPGQQAEVANTAEYNTIDNMAGLNVTWDVNTVMLSAGYDHEDVISGTQQFDYLNRSTELLFTKAGFRVLPKVAAGAEATAAFTRYARAVFNDNNGYSAGLYADWQPGQYFRLQARAGFCTYLFRHTSRSIQTGDLNSWYVDVKLRHEIAKAFGYSLDAGHQANLGIEADAVEAWYVRPNIHWTAFKQLELTAFFDYEHGRQGVANVAGNLTENYDWWGMGIGASYEFMKNLTVSLNYRLTLRSSNDADRSYDQNLVSLAFTYHPQ